MIAPLPERSKIPHTGQQDLRLFPPDLLDETPQPRPNIVIGGEVRPITFFEVAFHAPLSFVPSGVVAVGVGFVAIQIVILVRVSVRVWVWMECKWIVSCDLR